MQQCKHLVFDVPYQTIENEQDLFQIRYSWHYNLSMREPDDPMIKTEYLQITLRVSTMAFDIVDLLAETKNRFYSQTSVLQDVVVRCLKQSAPLEPPGPAAPALPAPPAAFKTLKLVIDYYHDSVFTHDVVDRFNRLRATQRFTIIFWIHGDTTIDDRIKHLLRTNMHVGIFHDWLDVIAQRIQPRPIMVHIKHPMIL